ncbi:rhodanese-like domain-containing protein [soil metagenome]|jgi:adenylyltransferase/sulfurtransferase
MPSVTPRELKRRLDSGERIQLLDVREPWEFERSRIEGSIPAPMSGLAENGVPEPDEDRETVVVCHHGVRSAQVVRLLLRAGFERVSNLDGGLDAYSGADPEVPRY